ncbi:MAG: DUF2141 domain-containing protein [Woeseiaceae bacterium]
MKKLSLALVLNLLVFPAAIADTAVTLEINGVTNTDGKMRMSVFDSKKAWLKTPMMGEWFDMTVADGVMTIEVQLPAGDYAFHVFQDLDNNGKMKTNFIGIPKEPTGVSRDAKGKFGPPKYKDAVVTVGEEPVTLPIRLTEI